MKRIKSFAASEAFFSLICNLTAVLSAIFLFRPFWEVPSDDGNISLLLEGAFGFREPHTIYSNIIYGKMITVLQAVVPSVRWHALLQYLFVFAISSAFIYLIAGSKKGRILSVMLLLGTFYEVYVSVQFTKTATYTAILAYMVLFALSDRKPGISGRICAAIAIVCATYSQLLRIDSFLLATLAAGIYGLLRIFMEIRQSRLGTTIRSYLILFVPVFVLLVLCFFVNRYEYGKDRWPEYISYNNSRDNLVDYHFNSLLYDLHGDELGKLGVSENDARMFITYQFADGERFDRQLMDDISALDKKGAGYINGDFVKAWIANIYDEIMVLNPLVAGCILLLGVYLASFISQKENRAYFIISMICQMILMLVVLFYYQYSCRWNHRIVYSLLLTQYVLLVCWMVRCRQQDVEGKMASAFILLMTFALAGMRLENEFEYQDYLRRSCDYKTLISYMEDNKDKLFVADTFTMNDYQKYGVFTVSEAGQFDNCVYSGECWTTGFPVERRILDRYGYESPLKALMSRSKDVVLVDNIHPEDKLEYCNEHGDGKGYDLELLEVVGGISLYRIK